MTASITVNGTDVFQAISRNRQAKRTLGGDRGVALLRPDIEALPIILAAGLDQPVTMTGLQEAQVAFLEYVLETGALKDMANAADTLLTGLLGGFGAFFGGAPAGSSKSEDAASTDPEAAFKQQLASRLDLALSALGAIDVLEDMLTPLVGANENFLHSRKSPLNRKAKKLSRQGQLTFAELLRVQPEVLIPVLSS